MYQCKQCNELIGENADQCPFCKHVITAQERKDYLRELEKMRYESTREAMNEYMRRIKLEIIITIVYFIVMIGVIVAIILTDGNRITVNIVLLIATLIYSVVAYKLHINRCPYCEESMGGGWLRRSHCPRCGGRLH